MAEGTDKDDKTEAPTARRLEEARKRGEIIYSSEAAGWIMLAAGTLALALLGGPIANALGRLLVGFFSAPHLLASDGVSLEAMFFALGLKVAGAMGLFALIILGAGIAARLVQDQPTWSTQKLAPSLERLDIIKGFSRVFGAAAFANFGKAALKFVIVGAAAVWALWPKDASLATEPMRDLASFWPMLQQKAMAMMGACLAVYGLIAVGDYALTRQAYMQRMRMSRREIKDELRQSEGDPQVRAKLRQIRGERARRRMMAQVPKATVVITNPTHYAVALKYENGETAAPICLAKGVDEVAQRIREAADEARVPIVEDPPLARALYASAELDEPIPREHYEAVAKVIGLIMRLAAQRRRRGGRVNPNRPT